MSWPNTFADHRVRRAPCPSTAVGCQIGCQRRSTVTEVTLMVDSPIHVPFWLYLSHLIFESQARSASKSSTAFRCMVGVT